LLSGDLKAVFVRVWVVFLMFLSFLLFRWLFFTLICFIQVAEEVIVLRLEFNRWLFRGLFLKWDLYRSRLFFVYEWLFWDWIRNHKLLLNWAFIHELRRFLQTRLLFVGDLNSQMIVSYYLWVFSYWSCFSCWVCLR
jgi:hypothetical protein